MKNEKLFKSIEKKVSSESLLELFELCLRVREGKATWAEAGAFAKEIGLPFSQDYLRQGCPLAFALYDKGLVNAPEALIKTANEIAEEAPWDIEKKSDGTATYDRLVALYEGADRNLTEDDMLRFFNLDPSSWTIIASKCQAWHGAIKGGGKQMLYNLRITIRSKTAADFTPGDFEAVLAKYEGQLVLPPVPAIPPAVKGKKPQRILEIDLADIHFGLLAWAKETGTGSYDLKIAAKYLQSAAEKIVERYRDCELSAVHICSLGDILHVDNGLLTTSHGTRQDTEGRIPKMIDTALLSLCQFVRTIEMLGAPIRYIYVPGNHDENIGYAVAKAVEMAFANDPNVKFDTSPSVYKLVNYGKTAVMLCHGEAPNKRLHNTLLNQFRKDFGKAEAAEIHCGHLHSVSVDTGSAAATVIRVNAMTEPSYWEGSMSFPKHERGLSCFIYNMKQPGFESMSNILNP